MNRNISLHAVVARTLFCQLPAAATDGKVAQAGIESLQSGTRRK
jgi:hypothetical protein